MIMVPQKRSTGVTPVEKDLSEDPIDINLAKSLVVQYGLKERFLSRMSRVLHAAVSMREDTFKNAVDIHLSYKDSRTRHITKQDLIGVENTLASIAKLPRGASLKRAEENLWEAFLLLSYIDARAAIYSLRDSFKEYSDIFADIITITFGFYDDEDSYSKLDQELGDRIIKLSESVQAYNESLKETNDLIHTTEEIAKEPNFEERLNNLIRDASFANELFELMCKLSFPKRAYGTLISVARTTKTFENVTFRDKSFSSATKIPSQTKARPLSNNPSQAVQSENTYPTPTSPLSPSTASTAPSATASAPLTPLTPLSPQVPPFPAEKNRLQQEATLLIGSILDNQLLTKHDNAWYSFGFVCTRDEEEERSLAGLYSVLLQEADSVQTFFHGLHHALESHSLVPLFVAKGYEIFREHFPHLEAFLSTPPEQRPTVWRLKQFILDPDKTEPPACLRSDYGFKMCKQREEVLRLKAIYVKVLEKMEPEDLHAACLYGRLFEAAVCEGVAIDEKDRRLMHNDYPSPFIGFDNDTGLAGYQLPLFRKQEKL